MAKKSTKSRNYGGPAGAEDKSEYLTLEQGAMFLNVPMRWLRRAKEENRIPSHKFGQHLRFKKSDLETFAKANRQDVTW